MTSETGMDKPIFQKMVHLRTGGELDLSFLRECTFVETLGLDGPKLMMAFDDHYGIFRDALGIREMDEVKVTIADMWGADGVNMEMPFTVLLSPDAGPIVRYNLMASQVYALKRLAPKTRIFTRRGVSEVLGAFVPGVKQALGQFPVVESYHCIAGERPSAMLRQMAGEQGALIWLGRDTMHADRLQTLMATAPAFEYHYNKPDEKYQIASYTKPSRQTRLEESAIRGFSGWNEITGRVKASTAGPILSKAKGYARELHSSVNTATLNNAPTEMRTAVDFVCQGNGFLCAGMALKLWWHQNNLERPLDESLPDKIVIEAVAHHYSAQKYFCRVKGAVPLEPTA